MSRASEYTVFHNYSVCIDGFVLADPITAHIFLERRRRGKVLRQSESATLETKSLKCCLRNLILAIFSLRYMSP